MVKMILINANSKYLQEYNKYNLIKSYLLPIAFHRDFTSSHCENHTLNKFAKKSKKNCFLATLLTYLIRLFSPQTVHDFNSN